MQKLKDKVVWITGASSGIGAALAREAAARGAHIVASARNTAALEELVHALPTPGLVLPLDLEQDQDRFGEMVQTVLQWSGGRLDVLVNNGGISQRAEAMETSPEVDRKIMEVNYFAQIALTKAVLPHMMAQKSGSIVVMSSIAGKVGFFLRTAYSASKHALQGYFDSLRLEVHSAGIRVLVVCPGKVNTPISKSALTGTGKAFGQMDEAQVKGVSAEYTARRIWDAWARRREEILIGKKEILAVYIKRFFPGLLTNILLKQRVE